MIRQLLSVIRSVDSSRLGLPLFFLSCMIVAVLELISVGVIPLFVTVLLQPDLLTKAITKYFNRLPINAADHLHTVMIVGIGLAAFLAFKAIFMLKIGLVQNRMLLGYQSRLSSRLLTKYLHWSYELHLRKNSAELIRHALTAPMSIVTCLLNLSAAATEALLIVLVTAGLVFYQPWITLSSVGLLAAVVAILWKVFKTRLSDLGTETNNAAIANLKWLTQTLGGLKEIRIAHREQYFHNRYLTHFEKFSKLTFDMQFLVQAPRLFMELFAILAMILLAIVLLQHGDPRDVLPTMAIFGAASLRLIPSANRIWNSISIMRSNAPYLNIYCTDMTKESNESLPVSSETTWEIADSINVSSLEYSYLGSQKLALNKISFSIQKGTTIGIAGRSGAGKSTLLDILLGLHPASAGDILIDGKSIWSDLAAWRATIGYVPQQIFLLDDSIRRNIALGEEDAEIDDSRILQALADASLIDLIQQLPEKLDTQLGERGARLSGGQRQRIGIARALYRNPSVLFLDEATSALDNETERTITDTLRALHGKITIVIIAHHTETMRLCDDIHVLEEGSLIAQGTLEQLTAQNIQFK